ncbi:MAG: DUF4160 domain-containing protein [Chitinispirillia bacterium]|jgi:hypothetical protein
MSPTIFYYGKNRFFFFSREEERIHVHVTSPEGEAKFWVEPTISLATCYNLSTKQLNKLQKIVEEHKNEIRSKWKKHFKN